MKIKTLFAITFPLPYFSICTVQSIDYQLVAFQDEYTKLFRCIRGKMSLQNQNTTFKSTKILRIESKIIAALFSNLLFLNSLSQGNLYKRHNEPSKYLNRQQSRQNVAPYIM